MWQSLYQWCFIIKSWLCKVIRDWIIGKNDRKWVLTVTSKETWMEYGINGI